MPKNCSPVVAFRFALVWSLLGVSLLGLSLNAVSSTALASDPPVKLPPWNRVQETAANYFAALPEYQPGDLLTKQQVEPLFRHLKVLGWQVKSKDLLLGNVLDQTHFVAQTLSERNGKAFMRKVEQYPLVYDRFDRLSQLPGGKELIRTIVTLPDGPKYMQPHPTPGLKSLAQLLPKQASGSTPSGKDFDKPTGKYYTAKEFLAGLRAAYEVESK